MTDCDALFDATAPGDSVFRDKRALDPLAATDGIAARDAQKRQLAPMVPGVDDGSLPPTGSLDRSPGTGKTRNSHGGMPALQDVEAGTPGHR